MFEKLKEKQLVDLLLRLQDRDRDIRAGAAAALAKRGDPRAIRPIRVLLADGDIYVRAAAAAALAALGEPIWSRWVRGRDDDFKKLEASRYAPAVDVFLSALARPGLREGEYERFIFCLGWLGHAKAVPALVDVLEGKSGLFPLSGGLYYGPKPRLAALRVLGALAQKGSLRARDAVLRASQTASAEILAEANDALKEIRENDERLSAAGAKTMSDPSPAQPSAGGRSPDEWIDLLAVEKERAHAVEALGELREARALKPLLDLYRQADTPQSYVRRLVIDALGKIGDARAVPLLLETLMSDWLDLQEASARALRMIGDPALREPLRRFLESSSFKALGEVRTALREIESRANPGVPS
jgi:HEAT repeat protein